MATGGSDLMSDEIVNIKCCVCAEKNRTREAEKYCCDCKDYYCSSCVGIHQEVPMMKGHKILNKADFRKMGPDGSLPSFPTQRCSLHIEEVVKMYCKDHDEVACASCIALTHRCCKKVVSVPEDIDNLYGTVSLNDMKMKFSKTKQTMEEIKKNRETKLQEIKEELNQKIESVKAFRQELQELLDLLEHETIQELRREFNKIEASLEKDINEAKSLGTSLQEATSQLKKCEGNKAQEFVCVKLSQKLAAGEQVEKILQTQSDEMISYIPDDSIKTFLQQKKTLGQVSIDRLKGNDSISKDIDQKFTPKKGLYKVKKQMDIAVKLQNDRQNCSIWRSCVTEDGCLLLADYNNERLKCMDLSTHILKAYIDLPAKPWDVCTISKSEAAVTLMNQSIQFVSLGDKQITATRTLKMKHYCFGLVHKDGNLFVSDYARTVYIYDMNGQEQKRIITDVSGKDIFQVASCIVDGASGDRIFVIDHVKGVIVLDSQGNYLFTINNLSVKGYYGVCTDGINVFISGNSSNNIVQFNQDFKMLGEIGKVTNPILMCFDHKKRRLIATCACSANITILELE